ncbi:UDP-2,4-diacetamido-2,4,6-trideoxy-beta-L-altropyranose hydrolase [Paenibacillus sp. IHB B 3415]|uniref:UDP-2,4-diacetamido-2,4, 6-trideoxy-beta-L-altropyranose hydrolase n=1 Tax=Paenibacillus sp. IHB B 3415 TaxID=867080 RepID=UPI00069AF337|nr:UDP-2,4-diacetamido-2,4,6-trideoxy-beta-L-altropyranose hydrolase [Paenibacillus sp. IHB B 3415]
MKFFIRADASAKLGVGHVMRCLALSEELIKREQQVIFICRESNALISKLIVEKGCAILQNETEYLLGSQKEAEYIIELIHSNYIIQNEDWIIIDHYSLDFEFEGYLRKVFTNIMVIDDLADRQHDCDVLLDTGLSKSKRDNYDRLIPQTSIKLLGPEYALLRHEYTKERKSLKLRDAKRVENIFVCFGGTDPTNETSKAIKALLPILNESMKVRVVMGITNPRIEELIQQYEDEKIEFLIQPFSIATLMSSSDLAICAGGGMTWERYCLGLPGIIIAIAANQVEGAQHSHLLGVDEYLGLSHLVKEKDLRQTIERLIYSNEKLKNARERAMDVVDGNGIVRVADILMKKNEALELRNFGDNEILFLLECRNEIKARLNSINSAEVSLNDHIKWVEQSKSMPDRKLMVAWIGEEKIAVVRLDRVGDYAEVSINVAKEHRGKGYVRRILKELEIKAITWNRSIHILQAVIKKENNISIKSFIKAGYREWNIDNELIIMRKKITD